MDSKMLRNVRVWKPNNVSSAFQGSKYVEFLKDGVVKPKPSLHS